MKQKEFIRIEYKNTGYGLYTSPETIEFIEELKEMRDRHMQKDILPNYLNDKIIRNKIITKGHRYRFCFKSIENLKNLIKENELKILKQYGFKIFKIKAHDYAESKYQAVVNADTIYQKIEI